MIVLLRLLAPKSGSWVCHADAELLGTLNDQSAVLGGNSVSDLGAKLLILHHQDFQLLDVVDEDLPEAGGQHVTGGLG